jgi:uncharacterized protein (DUF1800 family)
LRASVLPAAATIHLSNNLSAGVRPQAASATRSSATIAATPQTLVITATDPDGTNTGTARLGVPVTLHATVTGNHKIVEWKVSGPGTITPYGIDNFYATYTPPLTRVANAHATITAYMKTATSVTVSYFVSIENPVPTISSSGGVSPAQLLTGATQAVLLTGSGFVAGTVAVLNGNALQTTYTDYYHMTVQVPVASNAKGTWVLQMESPAPGGGWGSKFQLAIDPTSIALTANGVDGVNTGLATLGSSVAVTASVSGSAQTAVTWKLAGAGSLSSAGNYTAPAALPSDTHVTITAVLASNPAITQSYVLHVVNPVPVINTASRANVPSGATTAMTLSGTGFVPGTQLTANIGTVTTTYKSATSVVATVTIPTGGTGMLSLRGVNASPGGGTGEEFEEAILAPVSLATAARVLDQTTFGPTTSLIQHVEQEGVTAWLEEQYNTPQTVFPNIPNNFPSYCGDAAFCAQSSWWKTALTGNDQLRQRVAFALSEIFVISSDSVMGQGINTYANMLAGDAFTNWYTIMRDVTVSPAMGRYLDLLNNFEPTGTQIADENYARENMQLFNIGLNLLNQDGSPQLDSTGRLQPTYTQAQVQAFARAFTGWTFAASATTAAGTINYLSPMAPIERKHDEGVKTLLNGTVLPAGQTAEEDLDGALTNIFSHQNVPPFVCKQLIQHLVKSNPSPDYISRVAGVFIDDGNGVRGDMKAVLAAIFTDPEARAGDTDTTADSGHLREPVLWMTEVMRALGYVNVDPNDFYHRLSDYTGTTNEEPYASPSVFNFFSPGYLIPGTELNAPEFAIENTASVTDRQTLADNLVNNYLISFNVDLSATSALGKLASSPANLVDALGVLFMHGQMDPNIRTITINAVNNISAKNLAQRVRIATYLVITSAQFKIMH